MNLLKDPMIFFCAHEGSQVFIVSIIGTSYFALSLVTRSHPIAPSLPFPPPFDHRAFATQCDAHEHHHNLTNFHLPLKRAYDPRVLLMFKWPVSLSSRETFDTHGALRSLMMWNFISGINRFVVLCHMS